MCKKPLRCSTLIAFVLGMVFSIQLMGGKGIQKEHKLQADTTKKTVTYEETCRKMIEEDIRYYSPKVPLYIDYLINSKDWIERQGVATRLGRARDMRGLDALIHSLIHDERASVRANSAAAIAMIEEHNNDTTALCVLRQALTDSVTDVRLRAAKSLVSLGDKISPLEVLERLAKGEDWENWSVDWEVYMGLENATEEEIKEQKEQFRGGMREEAIELLGKIGTEETFSVLSYIASACRDETYHRGKGKLRKIINIGEYAKQILESARKGGSQ